MNWPRFFRCLTLTMPFAANFVGVIYAQAPFYQGNTITVVVSSHAGGSNDMRIKSLLPYLQKVIQEVPRDPEAVSVFNKIAGEGFQ